MPSRITAQKAVRDAFVLNIEVLEASLAENNQGAFVYAWSEYGLGVRIVDGKSVVVGLQLATIYRRDPHLVFTNGKGQKAQFLSRASALAHALNCARADLHHFDKMLAEAGAKD